VMTMLATSSPGKIVHLKGTDSAAAGAERNPPTNANQQIDDLALMKLPGLFPCRPSQRVVDPFLPAGAALLKVLEHILVDPQRDQFPHTGKRCPLRHRFRFFLRRLLEGGLGLGAGVVQGSRSSGLIGQGLNPFE
jgi:hypothetical protein